MASFQPVYCLQSDNILTPFQLLTNYLIWNLKSESHYNNCCLQNNGNGY